MQAKCIKCKGRGYCGRSFCPIIAKSEALFKIKGEAVKEDFIGNSPAPFVGHHGYPYLNVGILSTPEIKENAWEYDSPRHWALNNFKIPEIVNFRSSLVNSRFKAHAHDRGRLLELSQEVGMALKPVEMEVKLHEKPLFRLNTSAELAPMGPYANLENAKITSNTIIPKKVDKVYSDYDLNSTDAMVYLYENNFDVNFLTKLLSVGILGVKNSRKLVPTRWSITAVDDAMGKHLLDRVKDYSELGYNAYFGEYLGNNYLILTFPDKFSYELFEAYMPETSWNTGKEIEYSTDYENFFGRKTYAANCAGGYYAARLSILEKLDSLKRQGGMLALRFITGDYAVPLGVWVCREAARKAIESKPIEFSSEELMLKYAYAFVKRKFGYDVNNLLKNSIILKERKEQMKLTKFFS